MIRVPAGTTVQVSVNNALTDSALVIHGLHTRPGSEGDSMMVVAGATRTPPIAFSSLGSWTGALDFRAAGGLGDPGYCGGGCVDAGGRLRRLARRRRGGVN